MKYTKINTYELQVEKTCPTPAPIVSKYERSFIENQIEAITKDRDNYVALRNTELAECKAILAEMTKLKIEIKPVEEIISEEEIEGNVGLAETSPKHQLNVITGEETILE